LIKNKRTERERERERDENKKIYSVYCIFTRSYEIKKITLVDNNGMKI